MRRRKEGKNVLYVNMQNLYQKVEVRKKMTQIEVCNKMGVQKGGQILLD